MKPSTELFKLVKSLTKSEKRFFKLSSALQSGDKNYLKLFDYIESQDFYDEEVLKNHFKHERFVQHLPSEKNHLYKLILKSLRSFYSEQSVSSILKQELKNIEILHHKALYKECEKFVRKAKKIAQDHEKFYYWFELIAWEKKLLEEAFEEGDFNHDLNQLIAEEEQVIAKLRNLAEYQVLYSKINYVFRSGGFTRNEIEKKVVEDIADYHLIKGKNTAISTRATTMCYYIKGLCSATNREYQDSFVFFNKVRDILDRSPQIKTDLSKRYVLTLSHLLRCYVDSRDFEQALKLIGEIRQLEGTKGFDSIDLMVRIFAVTYSFELMVLNLSGEFEKARLLIPEITLKLDELEEKVNKEHRILFAYQMAYAHFGCGDYKKALQVLNQIMNDNEQVLRQDIYNFAKLLNLMIHFELDNLEFLGYQIKSTNRYLSKTERDYVVENVLVKQLRRLIKVTGKIERLEIFSEMKTELSELFCDERERLILDYIDVQSWIDSKLSGKSFGEEVRGRLKTDADC
jgi:tetratricopeptide (TPR) repeat protein